MKGYRISNQSGLTLVEVLVVLVVLFILISLLVPATDHRPTIARGVTCLNNLRQIGLSFYIRANDFGGRFPMQVSVTNGGTMEWVARGAAWPHFQVMSNELKTPKTIVCPADKPRMTELEKVMTSSTNGRHWLLLSTNCPLSYFVGVDAEDSKPALLLAGDDNMQIRGKPVARGLLNLWTNSTVGWTKKRHDSAGNVCFADGSIRRVSNAELRAVLANTGVATNRLAIP